MHSMCLDVWVPPRWTLWMCYSREVSKLFFKNNRRSHLPLAGLSQLHLREFHQQISGNSWLPRNMQKWFGENNPVKYCFWKKHYWDDSGKAIEKRFILVPSWHCLNARMLIVPPWHCCWEHPKPLFSLLPSRELYRMFIVPVALLSIS